MDVVHLRLGLSSARGAMKQHEQVAQNSVLSITAAPVPLLSSHLWSHVGSLMINCWRRKMYELGVGSVSGYKLKMYFYCIIPSLRGSPER